MNHAKRLLTILAIASVSGVGVWLTFQVEPQEESGSGRVQANRAEPTEPPPPAEAPRIRAPEAVESRTLAADPAPSSDDPPAAAASGLFGKVIDAATEAPIEGIIVTIGTRKDLTEVTTDEHGAFHFDASLGRRRFGLQLLSGARVSFGKRPRRVTPEDLPLVLTATIGPLYRIEIMGPEEVQGLEWSGVRTSSSAAREAHPVHGMLAKPRRNPSAPAAPMRFASRRRSQPARTARPTWLCTNRQECGAARSSHRPSWANIPM